jgi:hypothetical protein
LKSGAVTLTSQIATPRPYLPTAVRKYIERKFVSFTVAVPDVVVALKLVLPLHDVVTALVVVHASFVVLVAVTGLVSVFGVAVSVHFTAGGMYPSGGTLLAASAKAGAANATKRARAAIFFFMVILI